MPLVLSVLLPEDRRKADEDNGASPSLDDDEGDGLDATRKGKGKGKGKLPTVSYSASDASLTFGAWPFDALRLCGTV